MSTLLSRKLSRDMDLVDRAISVPQGGSRHGHFQLFGGEGCVVNRDLLGQVAAGDVDGAVVLGGCKFGIGWRR